jgi:hypothetical protein
LTRSDVASTQINGGDKMALKPMKKFNMGIKNMGIKTTN